MREGQISSFETKHSPYALVFIEFGMMFDHIHLAIPIDHRPDHLLRQIDGFDSAIAKGATQGGYIAQSEAFDALPALPFEIAFDYQPMDLTSIDGLNGIP